MDSQIKSMLMTKPLLDVEKLDCMVNRLKALSHPDRIAIIEFLQKNEKASVTEITNFLKIEQAGTSNHLKLLRDRQILLVKRAGKNRYYSLKYPVLNDIIECINNCV
jgi:DNA-binding transcriptional ArsR family regulator